MVVVTGLLGSQTPQLEVVVQLAVLTEVTYTVVGTVIVVAPGVFHSLHVDVAFWVMVENTVDVSTFGGSLVVTVTVSTLGGRVVVTVWVSTLGGAVNVTVTAGGAGRVTVAAEQVKSPQPVCLAGVEAGGGAEVELQAAQSPDCPCSRLLLPGPMSPFPPGRAATEVAATKAAR